MADKNSHYIFCDIEFHSGGKTYCYIADEDSFKVGDMVLVPVGEENKEVPVKIVGINCYAESECPYPIDKAKHIIGKAIDSELYENKSIGSNHEFIKTDGATLGAFNLEFHDDGSVDITQADYDVDFYGGMDVEATYTLDKENVSKLVDYLKKNHSGSLYDMMAKEFGKCFEIKSFLKACQDNGIKYTQFVWID